MYDDLIVNSPEIKRKLNEAVRDEVCPTCGSPDIEASYGVFISRTRYLQTMTCMVCSAKWNVTYDSDLNIVDVDIGG
jgi:formate dehydrogenase maturation protein FdhE